MKKDLTYKIYDKMGIRFEAGNENKWLKAVIINFGDERGDIIVTNDNFGTRREYPDFTEGKKKAGLNPLQIVWTGLDFAKVTKAKIIDANGQTVELGGKE